MNHDGHREHHKMLHARFNELLADWTSHNKEVYVGYTDQPIKALMEWSFQQSQEPTEVGDATEGPPSRMTEDDIPDDWPGPEGPS